MSGNLSKDGPKAAAVQLNEEARGGGGSIRIIEL
jgi:hypothetical protein